MVGPRVSGELLSYGTLGIISAIGAILIYLWFRFEWQFALGAMIANVHDLVLTLGFMSLMQIDFDLTSIAALLTILGYSLNDTVVIYDRIREMLRRYKRLPMPDLLNISINSTLSRSIITHLTVTLALLALFFFGGHAIHGFVTTMMFGVVLVGTYTSVFIAAPILIYLGVGTGRQESTDAAETGQEREYPLLSAELSRWPAGRSAICRRPPRSTPTARAASASPTCRIAARSCACRPASGHGRSTAPEEITEESAGARVRAAGVELFMLGTGKQPWLMPEALRWRFRDARIGVEVTPTGAAVRTYNILFGERRRVGRGADRGGLSAALRYLARDGRELSSLRGSWSARPTRTASSRRCSRRPSKRGPLFALYAFNAEIASVRDRAREPMPGEIRLQWWRDVLNGERSGRGGRQPGRGGADRHDRAFRIAAAAAARPDRGACVRPL